MESRGFDSAANEVRLAYTEFVGQVDNTIVTISTYFASKYPHTNLSLSHTIIPQVALSEIKFEINIKSNLGDGKATIKETTFFTPENFTFQRLCDSVEFFLGKKIIEIEDDIASISTEIQSDSRICEDGIGFILVYNPRTNVVNVHFSNNDINGSFELAYDNSFDAYLVTEYILVELSKLQNKPTQRTSSTVILSDDPTPPPPFLGK